MDNILGPLDYIVLFAVLSISAGIGLYYAISAGKQKTSSQYFLADRAMHWFPVGVSLAVSVISGIAFLGVSSLSYYGGPGWWVSALSRFPGGLIVATIITPVFYNLKIVSIYEYLEKRFSPVVRYMAVAIHLLTTFLVLGVIIYAPSLALNAVAGLSVPVSILTVGIICTFYSTIGGIKAVIWTDLFQGFIMMVGILVVTITAVVRAGGISEVWSTAAEGERTDRLLDFRIDPTVTLAFWPNLIGGMFFVISYTGVSQNQAQRFLTCDSLRSAKLSVIWGLFLQGLFEISVVVMGFVLFSFFHGCDPLRNGDISLPDQIVPFFLVEEFGSVPGMTGFIISAIFSSTLSTVSTGINGLTTVTGEGVVKRIWPTLSDGRYTVIMKGVALVYGILLMVMAWVASVAGSSLIVIGQRIVALLGAVSGVILIGMFVPRGNTKGAIAGMTMSLAIGVWLLAGSILFPPPPGVGPPLSTEFCSANGTSFEYRDDILSTSAPSAPPSALDTRAWIYRISFLYQVAITTGSAFMVALLVSFVTLCPSTDDDNIPEELLSPVFMSIYQKLPDTWRCKMRLVKQHDTKGTRAADNYGFDKDTSV